MNTTGHETITHGDTHTRKLSLSPSRAADFKTCPLLYRFRVIDRLPEAPTPEMARGTLIHAVLEHLFDLPPRERTPERAASLVHKQWERLQGESATIAEAFDHGAPPQDWWASANELLEGYFSCEDPTRLEPAQREALIESQLPNGVTLRGIVDRLDISPSGDIRIVDYKTGGSPKEAFEGRALFQMKFYALMLWRTGGTMPRMLRLLYLRDREVCDYAPEGVEELQRFERTLEALWQAILAATATQEFRPQRSKLCDWCRHQSRCPEFGGTPPPFPTQVG